MPVAYSRSWFYLKNAKLSLLLSCIGVYSFLLHQSWCFRSRDCGQRETIYVQTALCGLWRAPGWRGSI